jgi:hypothetical protein
MEDERHRQEEQGGDGHLGVEHLGQDEQEEDDHPQVHGPEGGLLEHGGQADPGMLHEREDDRHGNERDGEGKTEKEGVELEFLDGPPLEVDRVEDHRA